MSVEELSLDPFICPSPVEEQSLEPFVCPSPLIPGGFQGEVAPISSCQRLVHPGKVVSISQGTGQVLGIMINLAQVMNRQYVQGVLCLSPNGR